MQREIRTTKRQGSKWITQHKRMAVMMRDGLHCCYCGNGVENGASLTLDHITPAGFSSKPKNGERNIITCCYDCNTSRGNTELVVWLRDKFPQRYATIIAYVQQQRMTPLKKEDIAYAKDFLSRRSIASVTGNMHKITRDAEGNTIN
jgi:hypothetical protein